MSTIEQTVSMMQAYSPLSADKILDKLAIGHEQNDSGLGIPFDKAMEEIGSQFILEGIYENGKLSVGD
ncbi:MAG: hypothetical protein LUH56_02535 [Oscillospiraceae bacterium]|nr:hypothetical protein [Oscillospiraceae bacterium]